VVLVAVSLLLLWSGTEVHAKGRDRGGDFDFYLLALSIAPSFCVLGGSTGGSQECSHPSDADYRETPLTVHGLWPNRKGKSVNAQPRDCSAEPLSGLPADLRQRLRRYMPGAADGLDRHEWVRHGACSGLSSAAYFANVVSLAERANAVIGAAMREMGFFGQQVRIDDLLAAVAGTDPALAQAIVVDCKFARKQPGARETRTAYIDEIRIALSKDLSTDPEHDGWPGLLPVTALGFRSNSGCPGGKGFLPAGYAGQANAGQDKS
jgi:ribonuclease T2